MSATTDLFAGVLPFVHVAEEKSFRKAAQRLGVSTAAVSKAVLRLEADLGVTLLARTSRSVGLTPEGEAFAARCRDAVGAITAAKDQARDTRKKPRGTVHLTMSPILAPRVVRALPRLSERHPGLSFRITVTDRLVRLIDEGIDVAVRVGMPQDSGLIGRRLARPRWMTVASPRYLGQVRAPSRPDELARHACLRFLTPSGRPRPWSFVDHARGEVIAVPVEGPLLVDDGARLVDAALVGMGICQAFDFMVEEHVKEGRLVEVCGAHAAPAPEIHALCTRERARSANVRAVVAFLAEELASTAG